MNSIIKSTSKLIQTDHWNQLDEGAIMRIYDQVWLRGVRSTDGFNRQEFLAATEGELYLGAKNWCLRNTSSESEALKMFLEKFVQKIIPEYMSQRDFLTCVANDNFLAQVGNQVC